MTPAEVAQALHDRFPGRANALPTPMKRGTAVAFVILTTGVRVEIPWTWLRIPPHSN